MDYILLFLAGLVGANSLPHLVKGITGESHQTPFKKPSGPLLNVVWGMANAYFASWLFYWGTQSAALTFGHASIVVAIGVLTAGLLLATYWKDDLIAKGQ